MLHFDSILVRLSQKQNENKIINTYEIEKVIFKDKAVLHLYNFTYNSMTGEMRIKLKITSEMKKKF